MNSNIKFTLILFYTALLVGLLSCGEKPNTIESKKAELIKLKKQLQKTKSMIATLEKELQGTKQDGAGAVVYVESQIVQPTNFKRYINLQGAVESDRVSVLSSKMGGNVISINVHQGDFVRRGQLLIRVDDAALQSRLNEIDTRLEFVKDIYERQKRLWEQKAGSEIQYLQAENNYKAMRKSKETLLEQIRNTRIYAPFSGYVDLIVPKVGEMLMPGRPAIKITDMANVKVVCDISESYLTTIKKGVPVTVSLSDINEVIEGKIKNVSKSINIKNRTFRAEVRLKRIPKALRPSQICEVSVNDIKKDSIITVSLAYVQRTGERSYVYVVDDKSMTARKRYIETGLYNDTVVEVISGLTAGTQIITKGTFDLADGQKIKVVTEK